MKPECRYCHQSNVRLKRCICGVLLCDMCQQNHSTWGEADADDS